jgi:formylglycine-generating enzyme required for sulfatase activity
MIRMRRLKSLWIGLGLKRYIDALQLPTEYPMDRVNWFDAILYCNWLSRKEGLAPCYERTGEQEVVAAETVDVWRRRPGAKGYRLPMRAEWDYALRAGTTTRFYHGDDESLLGEYAGAFTEQGFAISGPVATMLGNVEEWSHDRGGPFGDESKVVDPEGPTNGPSRVLLGDVQHNYYSRPQQRAAGIRLALDAAAE